MKIYTIQDDSRPAGASTLASNPAPRTAAVLIILEIVQVVLLGHNFLRNEFCRQSSASAA